MKTAGLEFFYASDLKSFGRTEDGEDFVGEVYRVIAQDARGNRWAHSSQFPSVVKFENEWCVGFKDIREESIAACERLIKRITKSTELNMMWWSQSRPAYGSQAYMDYGMADDLALEKLEG